MLQEEALFSDWYSVCEIDNDCGASKFCSKTQTMMDDSLNFWIRGSTCEPEEYFQALEILCDFYGDYTLTTDPYDRTKDFY